MVNALQRARERQVGDLSLHSTDYFNDHARAQPVTPQVVG
jgi:hypothetical protein